MGHGDGTLKTTDPVAQGPAKRTPKLSDTDTPQASIFASHL